MLTASVISSTLATRVKKQARQAAQKAYYTELLMNCSQKLQQGRDEQEILQLAAQQLSILLEPPHLVRLGKRRKAALPCNAGRSEPELLQRHDG